MHGESSDSYPKMRNTNTWPRSGLNTNAKIIKKYFYTEEDYKNTEKMQNSFSVLNLQEF